MAQPKKGFNLLYPLIVAIVICFGAAGAAVNFNSELTQVKTDMAAIEADSKKLKDEKREYIGQIETLTEFINGSKDEMQVDVDALKSGHLKKANEMVGQFFKGSSREKKYPTLVSIYPDLFQEIEYLRGQQKKAESETKRVTKSYYAKIESYKQLKSNSDQEIEKLRDDKDKIQTSLTRKIQETEDERDKYKRQWQAAIKDRELLRDHYEQIEIPKRNSLIEERDRVIQKLKETIRRRKRIEDLDPDGEIIATNQTLGYAWINVGRVHGLRKGLIFRVFQYIKGGRRNFKGKLEIIRVDVDMAQARITHQLYRNEPIIKGDYIISPIFDKNQKKSFVFAGQKPTNRLYSTEDYRKMLEDRNQSVLDKVTNQTDFIVVLDKYEQSKAYEDAKAFPWIIFLREEDLLEYLGKK